MAPRKSLLPLVKKFFEHDPTAAARSLETMEEAEAVEVLRALPAALVARAFRFLGVSHAVALLKDAPSEILDEIVAKLDPQQGVAVFLELSEEKRQSLLEHMPEKSKTAIQALLQFPENSAGRIMAADFLRRRRWRSSRNGRPL